MVFITAAILQTFVVATNAFGSAHFGAGGWQDINVAEFKAFLGLILFMGYCKYPSREAAWENSLMGSSFLQSQYKERPLHDMLY